MLPPTDVTIAIDHPSQEVGKSMTGDCESLNRQALPRSQSNGKQPVVKNSTTNLQSMRDVSITTLHPANPALQTEHLS